MNPATLSDSNLLDLNLGLKILLSKSASMLAFLLTSSMVLTEAWITVNNISQIVNHVYNSAEKWCYGTEPSVCWMLLLISLHRFNRQNVFITKCCLLMLNQITFPANIYFLCQKNGFSIFSIIFWNSTSNLTTATQYFIKAAVGLYKLCFIILISGISHLKMKIAKSFDLCMHGVKQKKGKCWPLQGI